MKDTMKFTPAQKWQIILTAAKLFTRKEMPTIKLINKTKVTLNIYDESGKDLLLTLEPDGEPASLPVTGIALPKINNLLPVSTSEYGEPSKLPAYDPEVIYIVSNLYRDRSVRPDLLSPGPLLRDADGKPNGCRGLLK